MSKKNIDVALLVLGIFVLPAFADSGGSINLVDTLWVLIAAFLVFFMNAGFAFVETGFCRAKNSVNILAKNYIVFALAALSFPPEASI